MDPNNNNSNATPPVDPQAPLQPPQAVTPEVASAPEVYANADPTPTSSFGAPAPEAQAPVVDATPVSNEPAAPASPFFSAANSLPSQDASPTGPGLPISPIAPGTPTVSTPQAPQPSKKKKVILLAGIIGGAILLAIVGVAVYLLLTTVSKEDYRQATVQFNKVSDANTSLSTEASTLGDEAATGSDSAFDTALADTEESIATIKTENEALSKLKAVRFGEGAKLYKTFDDKLDAYLVYAGGIVTSVKNLRPAFAVCSDGSAGAADTSSMVAALKACSNALGEVTDIPNAEFKTFIDEIKVAYGEYATVYEKMSALSNPFGAQYNEYMALRDQLTAVQTKISDASEAFSEGLDAREDELSVKDSADALSDYLAEQQKK